MTQIVLPPPTRTVGTVDPPGDMNKVITALMAMGAITWVTPTGDTSGAADTANIQAAIAAGGCVLGAGLLYYSATLTLPAGRLAGLGWGLSTLQPVAGFAFDSSGAMINVTGAHAEICGFTHLGGPSANFASNPAGNGIQLQGGAQYASIHDLAIYYQNGWEIEHAGSATGNIIGTMIRTLQRFQNKQGIHLKGHTAQGFNGQLQITDIQAGQISGDSLFLEDIQDISVKGYNDSVVGASGGIPLHIKGACSAIRVENPDLGQFPNTGANIPTTPTILIEDSASGSPNDVTLLPGVAQQGIVGLRITGGATRVHCYTRLAQNQQHGADMQGTGFDIALYDSALSSNGQAGTGPFYEVSWTGSGSGKIKRCHFGTAQGTGAGQVSSVANFAGAGQVEFDDNEIAGAGFTAANVFATAPKFARRNKGYNPTGSVAIAVPASGSPTAGRAFDLWMDWTAAAAAGCALTGNGAPTRTAATFTTASNTTVTDSGNSFTTADIGRYITGSGIPAATLITAVASAGSATISNAATLSASGVTLTIQGYGIPAGSNKQVYVPAGQLVTPFYATAPSLSSAGL